MNLPKHSTSLRLQDHHQRFRSCPGLQSEDISKSKRKGSSRRWRVSCLRIIYDPFYYSLYYFVPDFRITGNLQDSNPIRISHFWRCRGSSDYCRRDTQKWPSNSGFFPRVFTFRSPQLSLLFPLVAFLSSTKYPGKMGALHWNVD